MKYLDLTLPTPEENLACDEALLDLCEGGGSGDVLRVWQSPVPFVVLGYANRAEQEVNLDACRARGIPVLRRCTGGGTVLQGPGCLSYTLCLRIGDPGPLATITGTNRWVMENHRALFQHLLGHPVHVQGHTDLALDGRKFSGNAQRRKRRFLLFHGSFLLGLDLALVEVLLPLPSKQPDYRSNRSHLGFLVNLSLPTPAIIQALRGLWMAHELLLAPLSVVIQRLVDEKYSRHDWNFRF